MLQCTGGGRWREPGDRGHPNRPRGGNLGRLGAMLDRVEADVGGSPDEVLADAGYCSEEELAVLEARGILAHVALGREGWKLAEIDGERGPATERMAGRNRRRNPSRCRPQRDTPARRWVRSDCRKPGTTCGNRTGTLVEPPKVT